VADPVTGPVVDPGVEPRVEPMADPVASGAAGGAAEGRALILIVEMADGRTLRLAARDRVEFRARLDFTSVLARIDLARMAAIPALAGSTPVRVSLAVGPRVSLVPLGDARVAGPADTARPDAARPDAARPDAARPDAARLALATGAYRRVGERFFDRGGEGAQTVAMMTRMINALPRIGRAAPAARRTAFAAALSGAAGRAAGPDAQTRFGAIYRGCEGLLEKTASRFNMRECLALRHVILQTDTNRAFWRALGGV